MSENLSIAKCKRITRPLLSKIHTLTELQVKYPSKFLFDIDLFNNNCNPSSIEHFVNPVNAQDRLDSLKRFIDPEIYDEYKDLYVIFQQIIYTLNGTDSEVRKRLKKLKSESPLSEIRKSAIFLNHSQMPRLSFLSAVALGKTIALGTKSTYYTLNLSILFDPSSIPKHLLKYHHELAEDIDAWLELEPTPVLSTHRPNLLLGYVIHLLVVNLSNLFYPLIPVLMHWLHENGHFLHKLMFSEFWLFLRQDSDLRILNELATFENNVIDKSLPVFWLYHRIGYWQKLVDLLNIKLSLVSHEKFSSYDSLFLQAMASTTRLNLQLVEMDEILRIVSRNTQFPKNTLVLISTIAQLINTTVTQFEPQSTSVEVLQYSKSSISNLQKFAKCWLALREDCVFDSLDGSNETVFEAIFKLIAFLKDKSMQIIEYLKRVHLLDPHATSAKIVSLLKQFKSQHFNLKLLDNSCQILKQFYMDSYEHLAGIEGKFAIRLAKYAIDLFGDLDGQDTTSELLWWISMRPTPDLKDFALSVEDLVYG